ncbi:TrmH family RNA methyltransferase [Candidatus Cloacimonadota bacterium]
MEAISKNHLREIARLKNKKFRNQADTVLVEGSRAVKHLSENNVELLELYVSESSRDISFQAGSTFLLKPDQFSRISSTKHPQQVSALVKKNSVPVSDHGFIIYLDHINEPGNLGTIIRTAEGAGASGIILSKETCSIFNPKAIRASMGSIFTFPVEYHDIDWLRDVDARKIATSLHGAVDLFNYPKPKSNIVLIIGSEAEGISQPVLDLADDKVKIPLKNNIESLNAAIAAGIAIYYFLH